jgi:hypothetical protein
MRAQSEGHDETTWERDDLARRLTQALGIARKVIDRLATDGYTDPAEPANNLRPEKVISETALLLFAASTAESATVRSTVDDLALKLSPFARDERMLLGVCLEPALAWDYAAAHVLLTRIGFPDPGFDKLLGQAAGAQARSGRERVPYRVLEQEWLQNNWRNKAPESVAAPSLAALGSVVNQPMDVLGGSREDVYAFAHGLMYIADFNVHATRWPRPPDDILGEAEAALARCLDEQDYDLGGEVLLAWPLTGQPWSAAATFGFRVLASVEDQAGFLAGPSTRLERLEGLEGDERTDYLLATAYHTAYVMGLLCATSLQPGMAPPLRIPVEGTVAGSAAQILPFLEEGSADRHWMAEFRRLSGEERDAMAGVLFTIAVRRHIHLRQFGEVHKLLGICHRWGLSDSPAASQTAEMLSRLATLADLARAPEGNDGPNP